MQHEKRHHIVSTRPNAGESAVFACGSEMKPPYMIEVEEECEECGGSGYDSGALSARWIRRSAQGVTAAASRR